jgi:hypothetical protein
VPALGPVGNCNPLGALDHGAEPPYVLSSLISVFDANRWYGAEP